MWSIFKYKYINFNVPQRVSVEIFKFFILNTIVIFKTHVFSNYIVPDKHVGRPFSLLYITGKRLRIHKAEMSSTLRICQVQYGICQNPWDNNGQNDNIVII